MATISLPATYDVRAASGGYLFSQGVAVCPYSQQRLVQDFGGKARVVEIQVPPLSESDADDWTEFFEDLDGCNNTFNLDLTDIFPHSTGATSVPFRLKEPNIRWSVNTAKVFGFSFEAVEVV